jgi:hypothetical protein
MTLLDMQRVVGRILTDRVFREAFVAGGTWDEDDYDLSERELRNIRGLRFDRLSQHADGLEHGRLELGLKPLPLTEKLLHSQLREQLARFCREFPPLPESDSVVLVESSRMARFLQRLGSEGSLDPIWAADLAQYEQTIFRLTVGQDAARSALKSQELNKSWSDSNSVLGATPVGGSHVQVLSFCYPISEIVAELRIERVPTLTQLHDPQLVLFQRVAGELNVNILRINPATAELVEACDGHRTTRDVIELVGGKLGQRAAEQVVGAIQQLCNRNVLALRPTPPCAR